MWNNIFKFATDKPLANNFFAADLFPICEAADIVKQ